LRGLHPILAILIGGSLCAFYWWQSQKETSSPALQRAAGQGAVAMLVGIAFGISTLLALSPVWMKLTHLALAHMMWFFLLQFLWTRQQESRLLA
jgi:cytochrome c oxidase assembly protein subunit 15